MPEATQEQIEEAAKKANAHNFIMEFPDGYSTSVGSASSSQISGGQKQRIAVRQVFYMSYSARTPILHLSRCD